MENYCKCLLTCVGGSCKKIKYIPKKDAKLGNHLFINGTGMRWVIHEILETKKANT